MPPQTLEPRGAAPGRRLFVEAGVGLLLVLAALASMVAGGSFSVTAADASAARPGASAASTLILQCPLGVHRVPLGASAQR